MEPARPTDPTIDPNEFDDLDDMPTVPGVYILPKWIFQPESDTNPVLEDPTSWDAGEDTKRFRVLE
jgi:hypothetical protein